MRRNHLQAKEDIADRHEHATIVGRIEDDPIAEGMSTRHTFIPVRSLDLQRRLVETLKLSPVQQVDFDHLCKRLQAIFHAEQLSALMRTEELYGPLDPDDDSVELIEVSQTEREQQIDRLIDVVSNLLFSAHYKRLSREEIQRAVRMGSQWGVRLQVDFDLYERLEIFARGYRVVESSRRRWQNLYREEVIELPEFQRLIMVFQLREGTTAGKAIDCSKVYLKTFKNIPETDLEILLPGSKVQLTMFDRGKILFPTLSGAAISVYKILRSAVVLTFVLTINNLIAWVVFGGAIVGYLIKSVTSYFRTKNDYQFGLTRSLYLKNLDNNFSVIYRIINEAEDQELLESMIGYMILWDYCCNDNQANLEMEHDADQQNTIDENSSSAKHVSSASASVTKGLTEQELDRRIEQYILRETGADVDFEIHDALGKLARLGLVSVDRDKRWTPVPIARADDQLDLNWDRLLPRRPALPT